MTQLLDRVQERDVDLLLAMHLYASEHFRSLVLERILGEVSPNTLLSCQVSTTTDAGETDVLLVVKLNGQHGRRLAVMLENKVDAAFQPNQAVRYHQRGVQGVVDGLWDEHRSCLVAPTAYIVGARSQGGWDNYLELEFIAEWAQSTGGAYEAFFSTICMQAVTKYAARAVEVSDEATAFWRAYRELATLLLPALPIMRLPQLVGRASPWPRFRSAVLPIGYDLEHKPQQGHVDLTVSNVSVEQLRADSHGELQGGVKIVSAGKSAAFRLVVPRVDHLRPFVEQEVEVLAALAAVEHLHAFGCSLALKAPLLE